MTSYSAPLPLETNPEPVSETSKGSPNLTIPSRDDPSSQDVASESGVQSARWRRGLNSSPERKLIRKLDFFIMGWACFGYFVRLLDTSNMTNAYVSGMKEDLHLFSDQFNLFTTFWTCGYIVGMIPSQVAMSWTRPSIIIPAAEVVWAILTFCFAAVKNEKQIYSIRFMIGFFEAPFYVGAMTLLGNWYTPSELAKRASIFYSASFAANMFSGYLQAAVYKGLNGVNGLAGWRWLFIMCGVITVPCAVWGFFAVPDSPYTSRAWYLSADEIALSKSRMVKIDRRPFKGIQLKTFKKILLNPWSLIFIINYVFFCIDTNPLGYFAIWVKSLKRYTVAQINVIPTGAFAIGFVTTILFGIISDRIRNRPIIAIVITLINIVSSLVLALHPSRAGIFYGYFTNAATYAYGPIMISWLNEYFTALPDERALLLGVAQTVCATFNAWLPLLIFNTGTQAPLFHTGYIVCTVVSVSQLFGVGLLWYLSKKPAMGVEVDAVADGTGKQGNGTR